MQVTLEKVNNASLASNRPEPLNSSKLNYTNDEGVRVSLPIYIDLTTTQRKELFNGVRTAAQNATTATNTTRSISGLVVEHAATNQSSVEQFLGMTVDNLRMVLFSRGGLSADLVIKLQAVAGVEFVNEKQLAQALTDRKKQVSEFIKANSYA